MRDNIYSFYAWLSLGQAIFFFKKTKVVAKVVQIFDEGRVVDIVFMH